MLRSFIFVALLCQSAAASAASLPRTLLSLNVFDQLQGNWAADFRETRIGVLSGWIREHSPDLVVFQEAQADSAASVESNDAAALKSLYPYRRYVHEMTGADGKSYGYWIGAKQKPAKEWADGFSFPGGVERKTEAALWVDGKSCVGVLQLHLSYQNSAVRVKEAKWIEAWLKERQADCANWIVAGDFNADADTDELQFLFSAGLSDLAKERKPTVGAFNPIRQVYGKDIPSKTIDWTLGTAGIRKRAQGQVVFDRPVNDTWLSDHAGNWLQLGR